MIWLKRLLIGRRHFAVQEKCEDRDAERMADKSLTCVQPTISVAYFVTKVNDIYIPDGIREFFKLVLCKHEVINGCDIHLL